MSRIIFVNRYFYPDLSATSQVLGDLAFHLAGRGIDVKVVTSRQGYIDPTSRLPIRERVNGVDIHRIASTTFGRTHLGARAIDYVSFYVSAFVHLLSLLRKGDIVVSKTDPPLISVVTTVVARLKRARQINWLQDLFPEVSGVLAPDVLSARIANLAKLARDWSLRRAEINVVLGELMLKRVVALGVAQERALIIQNWADDNAITPVLHRDNPLRREWGCDGKFVVAYSGNLGRAHEFRTLMQTAVLLKEQIDVLFLLVGGGAQLRNVRNFAAGFQLNNVVVRPYQPREQLRYSLGVADLHVVTLKPAVEGLIVPSKFYGIAAAARPTAFIGDSGGEIGRLVRGFDCGGVFSIGDSEKLAAYILTLKNDRAECERLGGNARAALEAQWTQQKAFQQWSDVLARLDAPSP